MGTRILLVEDDAHIARGLRFNFEAEGYAVEVVADGESALEQLEPAHGGRFDLAVLDVMLPGISGLEVLKRLRAAGRGLPVLMLTARDADDEVVTALHEGADDYLTKPFSLPVLLARIRTLLRRALRPQEASPHPSFRIGTVTVYPGRFELEREGRFVSLTTKELGLLRLLHERRGTAVSRGEILQEVWDLDPRTRTRVIDTFVHRLRKLIEPDPSRPRHLLSVRAYGYRLVDEPS